MYNTFILYHKKISKNITFMFHFNIVLATPKVQYFPLQKLIIYDIVKRVQMEVGKFYEKKIFSLFLAVGMCISSIGVAFADDYVFTDRNGKQQTVPDGEYSFATRVVEFVQGNPWTSYETHKDPQNVLGEPDAETGEKYFALTLGAGGILTVEFNIQITDGEGDDLYVFEHGPQMEDTKVELSSDLSEWLKI